MAQKKVSIKITGDSKEAEGALNKLTSKLNSFKKKLSTNEMSKFGSSLAGLVSGIGAATMAAKVAIDAIKGVASAVGEMTAAYKVQQKAETSLELAARNSPYINGEGVKELKNFASELQSYSNYGDETTIQIMAQLAASGRTVKEIEKIISASADLAASGAMSFESAVDNLNKTFSGTAGTLGKTIPAIKELTEEQLKAGEACDIVAERYKGMAQATADTTVQLQNAVGDFKEALGQFTEPLQTAFEKVSLSITNLATNALNSYMKFLDGVANGILNFIHQTNRYSFGITDSMEEFFHTMEYYFDLLDQGDLNGTFYFKDLVKNVDATKTALETLNAELQAAQDLASKDHSGKYDAEIAKIKELISYINAESEAYRINFEEQEKVFDAIQKANEAQEIYNKKLETYIRLVKEGNMTESQRVKMAADVKASHPSVADTATTTRNTTSAVSHKKTAAEIAAAAKQDFWKSLENASNEIEYREFLDGPISELEKSKNMYETAVKAYMSMRKEAGGAISDKNYEMVNNIIPKIGELKKKYEELNAIEEKNKEIEELRRIAAEYDLEKQKEKADLIAEIEDKANIKKENEFQIRNKELLDLKQKVIDSEILMEEEKKQKILEIDKAIEENKKQSYMNLIAEISDYTQQAADIMNNAASLMLENSKTVAEAEQAELELKYRKGEISEEEYQKSLTESKKKAAKEQYKIQMFQWTASLLQATANIAQGVSMAIAQGGIAGLITGALVGAAGAVQIASIVASKPVPPSFATGGIVQGNSYYGDKVKANVNSGEMILNATQQKELWETANGNGKAGGMNIQINNSCSNMVEAKPQITEEGLKLFIDARVKDSLKNSRYNNELTLANAGMSGDFYG